MEDRKKLLDRFPYHPINMDSVDKRIDEYMAMEDCFDKRLMLDNLMKLKEGLLETLSCIFSAVEEKQKTTEFVPYAKEIVNFINILLREEGQLNMDIIKSCTFSAYNISTAIESCPG